MATGESGRRTLVRVEDNPTMRREALDNLRQLFRANDETTKLYTVLQRLHESSPNEAPITADLARLGLNLDENTESSHQLAKEAYDRAPNDVNCAVTYAFSLHRLGRNAEALAIIQSLPPDGLHDAHAAVYVALVLVEGNELEGAKDYIEAAEDGKLYPEEKKLLEEAKTKLVAASAIPSPAESPAPAQLHRCRVRCPQRISTENALRTAQLQRSGNHFSIASVQSAMSFAFI